MAETKNKKYKALRITEEMMEKLSDVQLAFESAYMKRMTKDELIEKLVACLEDGDPAVWEGYCMIRDKKESLKGEDAR